MNDYADDYVTVEQRMAEFFEQYPDGSLQPVNPDEPYRFVTLTDEQAAAFAAAYDRAKWFKGYQPTTWVVYTAACYRHPDDFRPGIGVAMEPLPGLTPYTWGSEIQNAETSAWGRAIVAVGAAGARASAQEVRNRRADQSDEYAPGEQTLRDNALDALGELVKDLPDGSGNAEWVEWKAAHQKPLWSKRLASINDAATFVGGLLAAAGTDPFLDESGNGQETGADAPQRDAPVPAGTLYEDTSEF